jgi:hypothetical protein
MPTAHYSLRSLFLWFTIATLWLGAVASARFANLPFGFVATLAAIGTVYWFRHLIPIAIWYTLAVLAAFGLLFAILVPAIN